MTFDRPEIVWPPSTAVTALYSVRATADPAIVSRLINFFAQQSMIPSAVLVRRRGDELAVNIEQPDIVEHAANVIAEKMRSLIMVNFVELECRLERRTARAA